MQIDLRRCEVRYSPREDPRVPSVYWIWKTADWQARVLRYDWHCLRRTPESEADFDEDWVGWPLRKDYISPDFELQDAY